MIPLNVITLLPQVSDCETGQGVPLNVTAVAQVRIVKEEESSLLTAIEQFGGKDEQEIAEQLQETFEGHLRQGLTFFCLVRISFSKVWKKITYKL